ncbi:hypothetical protein O9G_004091 [Rozella allomycis CSF55]|uniref:Uncharacterized protein n=1 Tax=Rozella allomycis (strain CSF55) TaxID=988480 RepID=A0A075ARL5_ROZAC|nr:hypothetical protein O9G_004091 [Rozella allomycis CSF55]|eukprot:EPZ32820.1 hypothetical protein O9G_004091 [Rozella allomycis CSF55]
MSTQFCESVSAQVELRGDSRFARIALFISPELISLGLWFTIIKALEPCFLVCRSVEPSRGDSRFARIARFINPELISLGLWFAIIKALEPCLLVCRSVEPSVTYVRDRS